MITSVIDIQNFIDKGYEEIDQTEKIPSKYNSDFSMDLNKWKIIEHIYKFKDPESRYWDVSSYDILKFDESSNDFLPYMTFGRNYHSLSNTQIIYTIQNKKEFIITSSQYMSLTVLNLTDGEIKSYMYGYVINEGDNGPSYNGFCPTEISYFQDSDNNFENTLTVEGCFWGGPYEKLVIDNVDLTDLSETYDMENENIIRSYVDIDIDDEDDDEDDESETESKSDNLNDDEEEERKIDEEIEEYIRTMDELSELDIDVAIELIKSGEYENIPIQQKEEFKYIILKALFYYSDNNF